MREIAAFIRRLFRDLFIEVREFDLSVANGNNFNSGIDVQNLDYSPIKVKDTWGNDYEVAYFHAVGEIPKNWKNKEIAAVLNFKGEGLVFDAAGKVIHTLTDASVFDLDYKKELFCAVKKANGGESLEYYIECTANGLFGMSYDTDPDAKEKAPHGSYSSTVEKAYFGVFNRSVWNLIYDLEVLYGLYAALAENDYRKRKLAAILTGAFTSYCNNPDNAEAASTVLKEALEWHAAASAVNVTAIGHAHIDTAWLWPMSQTIKKCARTFSSMLSLMEEYKDFTFGASSACHYEFVKQEYPELYERVRQMVKSGRWELQGGMYIEADCMITGGESLVRQFVYGKNFFMDEFGADVKNLWLPDAFGFCASLPQIIKKSGCDYFLTQKISWNDTNKFPYHSLYWEGIDHSKVLTHFLPEDGYNSTMKPKSLIYGQNSYKESHINNEFISLYGIGDGGAGPAAEHVERGLRMQNLEGLPRVKFGRADEFFKRMSKFDSYPTWVGELYLELHRGCLTTQGRNKKFNRFFEEELQQLEMMFSCMELEEYPAELMENLWKNLLINQFHDIIPGSSITEVYRDTDEEYHVMADLCDRLRQRLGFDLFSGNSEYLSIVNTLSYNNQILVAVPEDWCGVETLDGKLLPVVGYKVLVDVKALSCTVLKKSEQDSTVKNKITGEMILENLQVKYTFNSNGEIVGIFDKENQREWLEKGQKCNVFTLYSDYPDFYEAWDINKSYREQIVGGAELVKMEKTAENSLYSALKMEFKISKSRLWQTVTLKENSKLIQFDAQIDWQECRKMLRVGFETVINAPDVSYDIQYGYYKRPNNLNTSWEQAKFEVCCHKYFDMSEYKYGVALLNNCKYGCHVEGKKFDLALLRSTKYPDFYADSGEHTFSYALMIHNGNLLESNVMSEAAFLNRPPMQFTGKNDHFSFPISVDSESVKLEVIKKAEKSEDLVIRLAERFGCYSEAVISASKFKQLKETDLLEWNKIKEYELVDGKAVIKFKPFEIKTFILK